jgi:DNA-3-methyladenine glycosylase II
MPDIVMLNDESEAIQYLRKKDKRLAKVISMVGDISYQPHSEDPYAFIVHEIIEQMLSIKAGAKIYGRLVDLCGGEITPEKVGSLSEDEIRTIGTSSSKARYIKGITEEVLAGRLVFEEIAEMSDEQAYKKLLSLKGIGSWTVKMYLIFVLDTQDILPIEDVAFLQSYKWMYKTDDVSKEVVMKKCKKWSPYSSIAARYLYRALDMGFTKEEFHLYK